MSQSSSAASSPTVCSTKMGAYPPVRVATHHYYASCDSTLAGSLPPSPRNQPPPYGDDALPSPPQYHDDTFEREKRHGDPLPRRTVIIRLCTSIFIAFIVCLVVAAVVGRIHDLQLRKKQDAQANAAHSVNGTRYTVMMQGTSTRSTTTAPATTMGANYTTSAHASIARPTGTTVATYSCPYVTNYARASRGSNNTASSESVCGLTVPFNKVQNQTDEEHILRVSLYALKDCVIARTSYTILGRKSAYRCALSCSEDGGPDVDGLQDGWKWACD